jgi:IclR family transcriptional regulator, acetate operon repressor
MPPTRSVERNESARTADKSTSAGKLLAILDAFGPDQPDFSLAELSVRAAVPKTTAHRLLAVLEAWRGVERTSSGRYRLGIKFFELGGLVQDRLRLREVALPYMEDLLQSTREMVHLAKLDNNDVLYIERLVSHRSVRSPSRVAGRVPASCTGVGKAILAFSPADVVKGVISAGLVQMTPYSITNPVMFIESLERIRRDGVSFDREEASIGLACVAAPIFNHNGSVLAAMSVSGPCNRISPDTLIPAIRAATLAVSRHYGYQPPAATTAFTTLGSGTAE